MEKENYRVFSADYCFMSQTVSPYAKQHNAVDYAALARSFDCILNNSIFAAAGFDAWELENGADYYEDDDTGDIEYYDIFQYYIVSDRGADILKKYTNEILYYNAALDVYLWAVTHYGTSWEYVLTDITVEKIDTTATEDDDSDTLIF